MVPQTTQDATQLEEKSMRVGFIGLGKLGTHIAQHLLAKHRTIAVHNRTCSRAEAWVNANGGLVARSPRELAETSDVLFVCVGDDNDLHSVVSGEQGIVSAQREGLLIIDHTTTSAKAAIEARQILAAHACDFVDAPVSGGVIGAKNGKLTAMVGCASNDFERIRDLLVSHCARIERIGDVGSGQLCKMVNQICAAGVIQSLAEGLSFAEKAGLDPERVLEVIRSGTAHSWQMDNRAEWMLKRAFDGGFACRLMRKDLNLCLDEARSIGTELPVATIVERLYERLAESGQSDLDFSALITLCSRDAL